MPRKGMRERETRETVISVSLDLDGSGATEISTGLAFFDHMLELMFRHALIDLKLEARGDLDVDGHHTVEDTGLTLGSALADALGDKKGISRFGSSLVPMDECLAEVAIDISGRPHLSFDVELEPEPLGNFEPSLARDFFQGLVNEAGLTLHVELRRGGGVHHALEAVFKAAGRALKTAVAIDPRVGGVPSTKGTL
ncbi:MAG TPA: imidazoleglycerol-phosphate dehydratase HisB [Candidatus Anoxymicrobiaceae bacterium]